MSGPPADLPALAATWRADDPDPRTRAQLDDLVERGDPVALADHLGRRLAFGTAGLRGALGPGPNRMNRLVVRQAAAGLARHLVRAEPGAARRGVVVARDARHGSAEFADDLVDVLTAHGLDVHRIDGPAPTPLAAFAVRHLGAAAGVVVTASHNPATDNGLKVFWEDGAQIVPPVDAEVAAAIERVAADPEPAVRRGGAPAGTEPGTEHHLGAELVDDYVAGALRLVPGAPVRPVPLALTALHGVGGTLVERVLVAGGHGPLHQVAAQRDPDPDFPTVAFPNPEEPGALDRLLELAERVGALAALANDPDADRLAVALPHATRSWEVLTGDQLGALLCHHLLDLSQGTPDRLVTSTVVSSRLVARICEHAGVHHAETLTGFKWLCRPAMANPAWTQVLAYEEALGYAVGPAARDKDGITAALVAADLVARLHAAGRTPWDVLDDLGRAHGEHVTANGSHRLDGPGAAERVAALVDRLASRPPTGFGGRPVVGADRPAPDVFRWWLDDDTRVVLRPSGTEPKVKHYCEAVEAVGPTPDSPGAARRRAAARLAGAVADVAALVDRAGD